MTLDQFIKKYNGKTPDFDGIFPGQCVDLYRLYCKEVLNVPQSPAVSGARLIWNTYLTDYFDRIPKAVFAIPKKGDIVVFKAFPGNPYGHVSICLDGSFWSFTSFDSNWSKPQTALIERHDYRYVLGWLRVKSPIKPILPRVNEAIRIRNDDPFRSVGTLTLSKWWQNRVVADPQKFTNDELGFQNLVGAIAWHQANHKYPHDNT